MVHQTMNTSNTSAPSASSNNKVMAATAGLGERVARPARQRWRLACVAAIVGILAGCALGPQTEAPSTPDAPAAGLPPDTAPLPPALQRAKSRWQPVRWAELPGWGPDGLHAVWNAWVRGCERPVAGHAALCGELRQLSIASAAEQQAWVMRRFQPYRVTEPDGTAPVGLLTGYYEPIMSASRVATDSHRSPVFAPPAGLLPGQPWFSRKEIDTLPEARAALQGKAIAWLADPIDALLLQIQGSGRLVFERQGLPPQTVRVAVAATNNLPYRSVNQWLAEQGAAITPWPAATKAWVRKNPSRLNELLWTNPRYVFYKEEPLSDFDAQFGPRGAQGVPLTPGHSIAVDPQSIPYGTPVWLATQGPTLNTQRLVMAQDTGGAIVGAVRADLFTGWGGWSDAAFIEAAALKQPLQLWVLWPRQPA